MTEQELADLVKSKELARQIWTLVKELVRLKAGPDNIRDILNKVFPNAPGGPAGTHVPVVIGSLKSP